MVHILFLIYTAVLGAAFLPGGDDLFILVGVLTGMAILGGFLRRFVLLRRVGHYGRKYLSVLLCLTVILPYALLPTWVAGCLCYAFVAGWLYAVPGLRLIAVRMFYVATMKRACRKRNFKVESARGGLVVRTPERVYDLRLCGGLYRVGLVSLRDGTSYTVRSIPAALAGNPTALAALLGEETLRRRLVLGKERTRTLVWSEEAEAERVLLFLPGLCEWRFDGTGEQALTEGSVRHGVVHYGADVFVERRLT